MEVKTYKNLDARETGYFNFATGEAVSADGTWDVSFAHTTIAVKNTAQIIETGFDELTVAPASGYKADTHDKKAIPTGSGNGWYDYSIFRHSITPLPDKVIVIKIADNQYVKVEILSYYKDLKGDSSYYTFRYAFL